MGRLLDVNSDLKAHLEDRPLPPPKKVFTAKYPIPVLPDYNMDYYPPQYWSNWTRVPLTESKIQPWLNVPEFRKQLERVGIDTTSDSVSLILKDIEFGADIGASGRARLPTAEKNAKSAYEHGDRL